MTTMRRLQPDEVMSEVVRLRLASLLGEHPPDGEAPDGRPRGDPGPNGTVAAGAVTTDWRSLTRRGLEFGRSHLAVVLIIALAGCLYAGYSLVRARTVPVAAAAPSPASVEPVPSPSASPKPRIRVHVVGEVRKPGVVALEQGARVLDAIDAAGGLTARARLGQLNLAAILADASQVVVGAPGSPAATVRPGSGAGEGEPAPAAAGGTASGRIDLNTATAAQLDTLPGVGPVLAASILAWRQQHQRFSRVQELQEVDGVGPKTYERLKDRVVVG